MSWDPLGPSDEALVLAFADFHGVNTSALANFKPPTWCHWCRIGQRCAWSQKQPIPTAATLSQTFPKNNLHIEELSLLTPRPGSFSGDSAILLERPPHPEHQCGLTISGHGSLVRLPQCPPPAEPFPRGTCQRPGDRAWEMLVRFLFHVSLQILKLYVWQNLD